MERLTFKSHSKNGTEYYRYAHKWKRIGNTNICTSNKYSQITQKLGKLEDIEQELGIPLEVLFKALKEGFYHKIIKVVDHKPVEEIWFTTPMQRELQLGMDGALGWTIYLGFDKTHFISPGCEYEYRTINYGKTWALTKEELDDRK